MGIYKYFKQKVERAWKKTYNENKYTKNGTEGYYKALQRQVRRYLWLMEKTNFMGTIVKTMAPKISRAFSGRV